MATKTQTQNTQRRPVQAALDDPDLIRAAKILCAVFGHPPVVTTCFGYINCARCGEQLGDSLGGVSTIGEGRMVVGHNCKNCRAVEKKLRPIDRVLTEGVRP